MGAGRYKPRAGCRTIRQMNRTRPCIALLLALWLATGAAVGAPLAARLAAGLEDPAIARQVSELDWPALRRVYSALGNRPVWLADDGPLPAARDLRRRLLAAGEDGLDPADYHRDRILALWTRRDANARAWLELYLSDAFLRLGRELAVGYGHPRRVDVDWYLPPPPAPPAEQHFIRIAHGEESVDHALDALTPPHPGYHRLKTALARYRTMAEAGPWPRLGPGPTLGLGSYGPRVTRLRERLRREGYDVGTGADPRLLDAGLEAAVRDYQRRNGLEADGLVGRRTRAALDVPLAERLAQIQRNLERWRWLPRHLGRRHVLVNMAGYRLDYVENGRVRLSMRTVVGSRYRATPAFADRIRYIELNPEWKVPPRLARDRILPRLRRDPTWLKRQHMRLFAGWYPGAVELDPENVNWQAVDDLDFPYKLVQAAGPHNALGRIKFMFPNRFRIYLHDTPRRDLFARPVRTFSGGCIRVERPVTLASLLLGAPYDPPLLRRLIRARAPLRLDLPRPVPIYLLYWTAWAEDDGPVHFRRDVYGRDGLITAGPALPAARLAHADPKFH